MADDVTRDADEFDAAVACLHNASGLARYCLRTDHIAAMQAEAQRAAEAQADTMVKIFDRVLAGLRLSAEQHARAMTVLHAELLTAAAEDAT